MSFPLSRPRDFIPLFTLTEEPDSPIDTSSEVSVRSLVSSPGLQRQSTVLVSARPSLASWPSFTSTDSSASTNCSSFSSASSNSKRVYKSKLTPDDFLLHAFGSTSRKSQERMLTLPTSSPNNLIVQEALDQFVNPSRSSSKGRKRHSSQDKRYSLPAPPPSGTFITTKPPKVRNGERHPVLPPLPSPTLSVSEMDPFSGDIILPQEELSLSDAGKKRREPLMTEEQWREKARKRAESRRQRRLTTQQCIREPELPIPIDIDCRPMEGSMGLPDPTPAVILSARSICAVRKRASSNENISTQRNEEHVGLKPKTHDADALHALKAGLNSSQSMDNLDDLAARCAKVALSEPPQST